MNEEEVARLVDARIRERADEQTREAIVTYERDHPTPQPAPPLAPLSPELIADLRDALKRSKGDIDEASKLVWNSPGTVARLQSWGAFAGAAVPEMRWALVGGLLKRQHALMAGEKAAL